MHRKCLGGKADLVVAQADNATETLRKACHQRALISLLSKGDAKDGALGYPISKLEDVRFGLRGEGAI
jgi:hypothetical protein